MAIVRTIAFDIGDKRIGVAITDPFNEYAIPAETYFRTKNFEADVAAIARIAQDKGAKVIVCGLPVNFDGSESVQTGKTARFIEALRLTSALPVETEDERFTTMQAREVQIAGGVKRDKRKQTIDSIAASYILDGYLARMRQREKPKQP
jgi:putative Holliday junction resolvase